MSETKHFRVIVDLSSFFQDHRRVARVFIKKDIKTVSDLQTRISEIFGVHDFYLSTQGQYLPVVEDIRVLHNDETVWVLPNKPVETKSQDSSNIVSTSDQKTKEKTLEVIAEESLDVFTKNKKEKKRHLDYKDEDETLKKKKYKHKKSKKSEDISTDTTCDSFEDIKKKLREKTEEKLQNNSIYGKFSASKEKKHFIPHKLCPYNNSEKSNASNSVRLSRHVDTPIKHFSTYVPPPRISDKYIANNKVNIVKIDVIKKASPVNNQNDNQNSSHFEKTVYCNSDKLREDVDTSTPPKDYVKEVIHTFEKLISPDGGSTSIYDANVVIPESISDKASNYTKDFLDKDREENCTTNTCIKQISPSKDMESVSVCNTKNNLSEASKTSKHSPEHSPVTKLSKWLYSSTDIPTTNSVYIENTLSNSQDGSVNKHLTASTQVGQNKTDSAESQETSLNPSNPSKFKLENSSFTNQSLSLNQSNPEVSTYNNDNLNLNTGMSIRYSEMFSTINNTADLSTTSESTPVRSKCLSEKRKIQGVGSLLKNLRESESFPSQESEDCEKNVIKRKRIRKRKRQSKKRVENTLVEPVKVEAYKPKPLKVQACPSIHIKFNDDNLQILENGKPTNSESILVNPPDCKVKENGKHTEEPNHKEANPRQSLKNIVLDEPEDLVVKNSGTISPQFEDFYSEESILKAPLMKINNLEPKAGDIIAFKIFSFRSDYSQKLTDYVVAKVEEYLKEVDKVHLHIKKGLDHLITPFGKFTLGDGQHDIENPKSIIFWRALQEVRLLFP